MLQLNSLNGKKALDIIRKAEYAHPGEEEAIDLVFKRLPHDASQQVLDVGSGLGATADYIRRQAWGNVTGIDVNHGSVIYANDKYRHCNFIHADVVDATLVLKPKFDVIVSFNAFYAFNDQPGALQALSKVASPRSSLAIFDFVDRGNYHYQPIMENNKPFLPNPLHLDKIEQLLSANGWRLYTIEPLHPHFADWYKLILEQIEKKKEKLIKATSEEFYAHILSLYQQMHNAIASNSLGGAIVRAVHGKAQ